MQAVSKKKKKKKQTNKTYLLAIAKLFVKLGNLEVHEEQSSASGSSSYLRLSHSRINDLELFTEGSEGSG